MDILVEILLEVIGAIIEIFFGETPIKRLPRPVRFAVLFVFWYGLSALLFWSSYVLFENLRSVSIVVFVVAIVLTVFGTYSIVRSMTLPTEKEVGVVDKEKSLSENIK